MLPSTTCLMIVALMPFFWTVLAKSTPKYDNVIRASISAI